MLPSNKSLHYPQSLFYSLQTGHRLSTSRMPASQPPHLPSVAHIVFVPNCSEWSHTIRNEQDFSAVPNAPRRPPTMAQSTPPEAGLNKPSDFSSATVTPKTAPQHNTESQPTDQQPKPLQSDSTSQPPTTAATSTQDPTQRAPPLCPMSNTHITLTPSAHARPLPFPLPPNPTSPRTFIILITTERTVTDVKHTLQRRRKADPRDVRIIARGRQLLDGRELGEYGVQRGNVVVGVDWRGRFRSHM